MDFEQNFNKLLNEYNSKQTIPDWFVSGYKSLISKNITIEDWNRVYLYLQNLSSDDEVLLKILKLVKNNIPTKLSQLENDSRYVTQDEWASDVYTENLHVDVIRNDPEFYFMDDTGRFQTHRISYKADKEYVDEKIPTKVSQLANDKGYLTSHQDISGKADIVYVNAKIASLINSAPSALDTLGELATAIKNHEDAYDGLLEVVGNKSDKSYVDAELNKKADAHWVSSMELSFDSSIDRIDEELKTKANINDIPTKVSQLENDANYADKKFVEDTLSAATGENDASMVKILLDKHKSDTNNPHNVTASQLGLGNVNNTSDIDKPISTAVQMALNAKANKTYVKEALDEREIYTFVDLTPTGIDYAEYKIIDFFNMLQELGYADLTDDVVNSLKIKLKYDGNPIHFLEFKFYVANDELQIDYVCEETLNGKYIGTYFTYALDDTDSDLFGLTEELGGVINSSEIYGYLKDYLPKSGGTLAGNLDLGYDSNKTTQNIVNITANNKVITKGTVNPTTGSIDNFILGNDVKYFEINPSYYTRIYKLGSLSLHNSTGNEGDFLTKGTSNNVKWTTLYTYSNDLGGLSVGNVKNTTFYSGSLQRRDYYTIDYDYEYAKYWDDFYTYAKYRIFIDVQDFLNEGSYEQDEVYLHIFSEPGVHISLVIRSQENPTYWWHTPYLEIEVFKNTTNDQCIIKIPEHYTWHYNPSDYACDKYELVQEQIFFANYGTTNVLFEFGVNAMSSEQDCYIAIQTVEET